MPTKILLLLAVLLCSCSSGGSDRSGMITLSGNAMTMDYKILVSGSFDADRIKEIQDLIVSTFEEVHTVYNIWNPDSELSRLNSQPGEIWIPLSPELERLILFTGEMVEKSGGYFDPTISSAYKLWKSKLQENTLPSDSDLQMLKAIVGWDRLKIRDHHIWKMDQNVVLDLGGIAKGYCVDLLAKRLVDSGIPNCYVEWGGEIRAEGMHPEGRPWRVYISNLRDTDPNHALALIDLESEALATSGDYLQQWEYCTEDGEVCVFTHILNPFTLTPLKVTEYNICSATVKARSCAQADALATAAMIFSSTQEAEKWTESLDNTTFWFVTRKDLKDD